ncbi:MAG: aminotransferase class III-fold pyridoxal phosphate-dependent enzyme [Desulfobacterales bacterium]|nr:aminotransferase class III-fold pyridoxal phosphate-dependent enzyme [Desulfobacterales bacterium]MDP6808719.1 aminotransferase class III-fold pyridoxal phosphate-dependent enzyme [Desulfobacterales bacterium]
MPTDIIKSLMIQERAKSYVPGMTQLLSKRPDRFSMGIWPAYYSKAKGAHTWDLDGNRYLDMSIGGIGCNVLGYADPDVDQTVIKSVVDGTSCSLNCPEEIELAELLCRLHPWAQMVRYARSGGEAMTIAVRIARSHSGKDKIAFCGYHGWHDWYLAANLGTKNALGDHLISGLSPAGVPAGLRDTAFPFRYNRTEELKGIIDHHGKDLAAIVLEPIRNVKPAPSFIEQIRGYADETGAILILDEISAGFRLTTGGSHLVLFKQNPDIAVFSKALGNGYPISAVIGKSHVMQAAQQTFISSTNWTDRVGPVAAVATIRKHERLNVAKHLTVTGGAIQNGWRRIAKKYGIGISVSGLKSMGHFSFEDERRSAMKAFFIQRMLDQGILASNLFYAMYAHEHEHIELYLNAMDAAFFDLAECMRRDDIEKNLKGLPSVSGFERLN